MSNIAVVDVITQNLTTFGHLLRRHKKREYIPLSLDRLSIIITKIQRSSAYRTLGCLWARFCLLMYDFAMSLCFLKLINFLAILSNKLHQSNRPYQNLFLLGAVPFFVAGDLETLGLRLESCHLDQLSQLVLANNIFLSKFSQIGYWYHWDLINLKFN